MTSQFEAPDPGRHAWLDGTPLVGKGMLEPTAGAQAYELYVLC